jgi:hypothetical protein
LLKGSLRIAEDTIADVEASGLWPGKVVTEVTPAGPLISRGERVRNSHQIGHSGRGEREVMQLRCGIFGRKQRDVRDAKTNVSDSTDDHALSRARCA